MSTECMVDTIEVLFGSNKRSCMTPSDQDFFVKMHYRHIMGAMSSYPTWLWPALLPVARHCAWTRPGYHKHIDEIRNLLVETLELGFFCIDHGYNVEL